MPAAIGYQCSGVEVADQVDDAEWSVSESDIEVREFERRLRECHRVVYQVAFGVLRDHANAEEIAQDAFLRAYRKLSSLRDPHKFQSWVTRVSLRLALNRRRADGRARRRDTAWHETRPPFPGDAETVVAQREFQVRLQQEIERLPKKLRAVVLLSAVQGFETRDIAAILRIPEGTVRSRLHLARKELLEVFCDEAL